MLNQFILNYFPVASLHSLKVLQCLHHLASPVQNHDSRALDTMLNIFNCLGNNFYLRRQQFLFKYALSAEQLSSVLIVRVNQCIMLGTLLFIYNPRRRQLLLMVFIFYVFFISMRSVFPIFTFHFF
jgi:hypothetical protein